MIGEGEQARNAVVPVAEVLDRLRSLVGPAAVLTGSDMAPHLEDWTGRFLSGAALAVVRPADTGEVSAVMRLAAEADLVIVPQGGNTGAVAGAIADDSQRSIVLNLNRMRRVRDLDAVTPALIADAGCILAEAQAAVGAQGMMVPLGIGSEGSATLGGLVATNAGGIQAVRFGVMRNQVLGLEVVLPDGRVLDMLRTVQKDNMGYDLKHLFIGAEGTLGIVTGVALKLTPSPRQLSSALLAVNDVASALEVLKAVRVACGDTVLACELIQRDLVLLASRSRPQFAAFTSTAAAFDLLLEVGTPSTRLNLAEVFEETLGELIDKGVVLDGTVASSEAQRSQLWLLREAIVADQRLAGEAVRFDVALPLSGVAEFLDRVKVTTAAIVPGCRPLSFGHIGDGNIHLSVVQPPEDLKGFLARRQDIIDVVHTLVLDLRGSICAEHGVGRKLRREAADALGAAGEDVMRAVKTAIDPDGRMNPGVLLI